MDFRIYECVQCEIPQRTLFPVMECPHCGGRVIKRTYPSDSDMLADYPLTDMKEFEALLGEFDGDQD